MFETGNTMSSRRKNHRGGRPEETRKQDCLDLINKVWTDESREKIVNNLIAAAEEGKSWALTILFDRAYGKATSPADQRLAEARAQLAEQQYAAKIFHAQASFLRAQAKQKEIESSLFPLQFVTPDQEQDDWRVLLGNATRFIQRISPEEWASYAGPEGLQLFKERVGADFSKAIEETLGDGETIDAEFEEEAEEEQIV